MKLLIIPFLLLSSVYCASFYSADLGSKAFAIGSVTNGKVDLVLNEQSKRMTSTLARYVDGVYLYGDPVQQSKRDVSYREFLPWNENANINITTDFFTNINERLPTVGDITLVVPPMLSSNELHQLASAIKASHLSVNEVTLSPLMVALNYVMYHTQQFSAEPSTIQVLDLGYASSYLAFIDVSYSNFVIDLNMTSVEPFNFTGKNIDSLISRNFHDINVEKMKKALTNSNIYVETNEDGEVTKITATQYNDIIVPTFSVTDSLNASIPLVLTGGSSRTRGLKTHLIERGFTLLNVNVEESPALGGALYAARSISRIKPTISPKIELPLINSTEITTLQNFTKEAATSRKTLKNYHTIINGVENATASSGDEDLKQALDDVTSNWCYDVQCMNSAIAKLEEAVQTYIKKVSEEKVEEEVMLEDPEVIESEDPIVKEDL